MLLLGCLRLGLATGGCGRRCTGWSGSCGAEGRVNAVLARMRRRLEEGFGQLAHAKGGDQMRMSYSGQGVELERSSKRHAPERNGEDLLLAWLEHAVEECLQVIVRVLFDPHDRRAPDPTGWDVRCGR